MTRTSLLVLLAVLLGLALPAAAQAPREDVIWARVSPNPIVLDGVLDEAAWAAAETKVVVYGENAGDPGSGWKAETGWDASDPTEATLKFLVRGDQLYLGAEIPDISVGGSREWTRFDGLLMDLKNHAAEGFPKAPAEYFYSWWYPDLNDPQPAGQLPDFRGYWSNNDPSVPRTPEQIAAWDAVTVVHGLSNNDATLDTGYTVEMRFDLAVMGYDITRPEGDVIEWNVSIYDTDYFWPPAVGLFSSNRVWWQDPWGNTGWYNEVRIHARPDVTTTSGPVPAIDPELEIRPLAAAPVIDGALTEPLWNDPGVYTFDLRWDDDALRATYDGVGPYRAGQYQPPVHGDQAFVSDPADGTVKVFYNGTTLYFGFEVRDEVVQYHTVPDRWDGFVVSIEDQVLRHTDNNLLQRRLAFQVGADGEASAQDYLLTMVLAGTAEVALNLMAGTTVDTLGLDTDTGYTAELAIDLTALSYPADLGDRTLHFGVTLYDGDSYLPIIDSYGTRTWWYREREFTCCAPWAYLAPNPIGVGDDPFAAPAYAQVFNVANPSRDPRISFALPHQNSVTLEVYDLRGRLVERRQLGVQQVGEVPLFTGRRAEAGVYLYRLRLVDPATGAPRTTLQGKTVLLK
ncbi:MAG TPA: sugar-binding protein [Candidatus Krumholzibacteria bacterium]|nr:sugar-binding protein [Candidatus Krumholzibacteria bacterium]HPD70570.1 sugar-binding protein [Candidatus Krumholzibacteria bacterium]HRY39730.1 sugar-binding protein [Candidatus Krumholzibacteria bacterium]